MGRKIIVTLILIPMAIVNLLLILVSFLCRSVDSFINKLESKWHDKRRELFMWAWRRK